MSNKFVGFLETVGKDFLKYVFPWLVKAEQVVSLAFPSLGPLFNLTANAVVAVEQNFAALGQQSGTGAQKLASVVQSIGGLIAQGLADAGKSNTAADVQQYINSVVNVLNAAPPPAAV